MKELKIYEAGKMSGLNFYDMNQWRNDVKALLIASAQIHACNINVMNPCDYYNFEAKRHQSEAEVMDFDIHNVITSDLIVVNVEGLKTSDGTKIELYEAWCQGIPVIALDELNEYEELHPWIQRCITRVEKNMSAVVGYISDFYMS